MRVLLVTLLSFLLLACDATPSSQILKISGPTMGTTYHIAWVSSASKDPSQAAPISAEQLQELVDTRLVLINKSMSTYDPSSEISRLNQNKIAPNASGWIAVSAEFADVLGISLDVWHKSQGAFDISVGPLVNLWGFGPDARPTKTPSDEQISAAKARMGTDHIEFDSAHKQLRLSRNLYLDMSAVAKGWATDDIAKLLEQQGIESYMVEIGGEIRTNGSKPESQPWRIAIERPQFFNDRNVALIIEPGNRGVATSGSYRNYYEDNGVRYSHTIDPANGYPVAHKLASVTVVHKSTGYADAWATAITVLGPEQGLALAEKYELAVFMLVGAGDGFTEQYSSAFLQLFPHVAEAGE